MSHNITLAGVRFTDTAMLANVVRDVSNGQASLDMTATSFRTYMGQPTGCDAKIAMPGKHDIGLKKNADASYTPVFDPYAMTPVFRAPNGRSMIGELQREYGLRQAEYEAAQSGFTTERITNTKTGVVTLECVAAD